MTRMIEISTKAGDGVFVVQKFSGREELGRPYEYHLELLSERGDITAEQLLGTNATVALELPDSKGTRSFNGYITRFTVQGSVRTPAFKSNTGFLYLVTLSPGLWFMTRSANSRIFPPDKAINDVIMQVLQADSLMKSTSSVDRHGARATTSRNTARPTSISSVAWPNTPASTTTSRTPTAPTRWCCWTRPTTTSPRPTWPNSG